MRLIDADIAMNMISDEMITDAKAVNIFRNLGDIEKVETLNMACARHVHMIEQLPTIDANPVKHGEWIYGEHDKAMCDGYWCDQCGFFVPWDYEHKFIDFIKDYHWCPSCGAKMDEVTE